MLTDTGLVITVQLYLLHRFCHHCPDLHTDIGFVIIDQLYLLTRILSRVSSYTYRHKFCHHYPAIRTDTGLVIIVQPYLRKQVLLSKPSRLPGGQEQVKLPTVFLHQCEHLSIPRLHSSMSVTVQTYTTLSLISSMYVTIQTYDSVVI